jgi:hypothetical protein
MQKTQNINVYKYFSSLSSERWYLGPILPRDISDAIHRAGDIAKIEDDSLYIRILAQLKIFSRIRAILSF